MKSLTTLALLCLVLFSCATPPTQETLVPPDEVRFVVLGDTQFGNMAGFERMVHEIEMIQPHFVIQVGDLIHGYTYDREQIRREWRMFRRQLEPLTAPFFPVPGNHDVVTPESEEVYAEEWGENRFHYSFDIDSTHIVSLNSFWQEEDDRIMLWQREWLAEDLAAFAERQGDNLDTASVFIFLHSPLWRYAQDHPGRADWLAVQEILADYPVRLVVGGHTHEYVVDQMDGIHYLVINSSKGWEPNSDIRGGGLNSFLHVTVRDGDTTIGAIEAGSIYPHDTVNSAERGSVPKHYIGNGTLRLRDWRDGAPLDTTIAIPLTNRADQDRLYRLDWRVPFGTEAHAEPHGMWLPLAAGESATPEFRLTADAAPGAGARPWLEISADSRLRTGYVSRDWESRYREEIASKEMGLDVVTTHIPLEEDFTFRGRRTIFVPPVTVAKRLEGSIAIDGDLSDSAWLSAEAMTEFNTANGATPEVKTEIRLLWDDEGLYLSAMMEEPNPAGMLSAAEGDIPLTWNDDDLELFFDADASGDLHRLFQNCAGTRFNSNPTIEPKYYTSTYESAIHIGDDHWTLEMHIPWAEMGAVATPVPGEMWNMQIGRHRQQSENVRLVWSGTGLYGASRYGVLEFK